MSDLDKIVTCKEKISISNKLKIIWLAITQPSKFYLSLTIKNLTSNGSDFELSVTDPVTGNKKLLEYNCTITNTTYSERAK